MLPVQAGSSRESVTLSSWLLYPPGLVDGPRGYQFTSVNRTLQSSVTAALTLTFSAGQKNVHVTRPFVCGSRNLCLIFFNLLDLHLALWATLLPCSCCKSFTELRQSAQIQQERQWHPVAEGMVPGASVQGPCRSLQGSQGSDGPGRPGVAWHASGAGTWKAARSQS